MVEVYEDRELRSSLTCECAYCWVYVYGQQACFCNSTLCTVCGGCGEHCKCAECEACGADCSIDDEKCPTCGAAFVKMSRE
jgi:hypothetical protein